MSTYVGKAICDGYGYGIYLDSAGDFAVWRTDGISSTYIGAAETKTGVVNLIQQDRGSSDVRITLLDDD